MSMKDFTRLGEEDLDHLEYHGIFTMKEFLSINHLHEQHRTIWGTTPCDTCEEIAKKLGVYKTVDELFKNIVGGE